jgi:hypothetical protein
VVKAIFSSHERLKLYNFANAAENPANLNSPNIIVAGNNIRLPDFYMSPFTPSGRRTTGFQIGIHTYVGNSIDPRDGVTPVSWTDSVGGLGFSVTVWRLSNQMNRWAQFKTLTGLLVNEIAVTSDIDCSELFFSFDPTKFVNPTGAFLLSFLEL